MTTDSNKLLERLRTYYGDDLACRMLLMDARHALEALAGEVEALRERNVKMRAFLAETSTDAENRLRAERDRLKAALETIAEEHDAGRHDGLPEPCPAHDADTMFYVARKALEDDKQ